MTRESDLVSVRTPRIGNSFPCANYCDLGGGQVKVWALHNGTSGPTADGLIVGPFVNGPDSFGTTNDLILLWGCLAIRKAGTANDGSLKPG